MIALVIALVQQHRHHKEKRQYRDADRYETNLRDIPYMGTVTPRAPTETTSLCPRITDDEPVEPSLLPGI